MSLKRLYEAFSVSPWLDSGDFSLIEKGHLHELLSGGARGLTINPADFVDVEKSISYNEKIRHELANNESPESTLWNVTSRLAREACDVFRPVYDKTNGADGFVCVPTDPLHAHDSKALIRSARKLWKSVRRANLMVKIPATSEGLRAVTVLTSEGINVNVMLVFGLRQYLRVMDAYMSGLEEREGSLRHVHGTVSFFVGRLDAAIDPLLAHIGTKETKHLRGKAATSQAIAAYGLFLEMFNPAAKRWSALRDKGANTQRLLWASTSVKNPDYDPLVYVNELLLPATVTLLPPKTLKLVQDHHFTRDPEKNRSVITEAHSVISELNQHGVVLDKIADVLLREGVKEFHDTHALALSNIKQLK